jgi:hypothetical protein
MLMQHHLVLETELREKLVGSLVLLKKKDLLDSPQGFARCRDEDWEEGVE